MPVLKLSPANQNLELYYEIHGEGETKIMFIMGLLTEGTAWYRQVIDELCSFHHRHFVLLDRVFCSTIELSSRINFLPKSDYFFFSVLVLIIVVLVDRHHH